MTRSGEATFRRTGPSAGASAGPSRGPVTAKDDEPAASRADLEERGVAFRSALREQMEAPLSPEQAREWLRQCEQLAGAHERHTRDNSDAQQTWRRVLEQDQPQVVASLRATASRSASTPITPSQLGRLPDGPLWRGPYKPPGRTR